MKQLFSNQRRLELLTSALEGGSNYWYLLDLAACKMIEPFRGKPDGSFLPDRLMYALTEGLAVPVSDIQTEEVLGKITKAKMDKAERIMLEKYPHDFADVISETDDANTADVWLQLCVIGKLF